LENLEKPEEVDRLYGREAVNPDLREYRDTGEMY
jgi:hypothetical protein